MSTRLDAFAHEAREEEERIESARGESLGAAAIAWRIKMSCFATFAYGYFQSSVVLFLPLYLVASKHVREESTILITAFFAAGTLNPNNTWTASSYGFFGAVPNLTAYGYCWPAG